MFLTNLTNGNGNHFAPYQQSYHLPLHYRISVNMGGLKSIFKFALFIIANFLVYFIVYFSIKMENKSFIERSIHAAAIYQYEKSNIKLNDSGKPIENHSSTVYILDEGLRFSK